MPNLLRLLSELVVCSVRLANLKLTAVFKSINTNVKIMIPRLFLQFPVLSNVEFKS